MKDITGNVGKKAGKIWMALNEYGPLPKDLIMKKGRLDEKDFYYALGWLARENKICKYGQKYQLGDTNLTEKIGNDAGKIWNTLKTQGDIDVSTISYGVGHGFKKGEK